MPSTEIERMAHMWNVERLSMGQIAAALRVTRNTVSGIINRNRPMFEARRDATGRKPRAERKTKPREPAATASQKANERRKAFHAVKVAEEAAAAPVEPVAPEINGKEYDAARLLVAKDLISLGSCDCRWPLNEGGPFLFCCAEVVAGSPYCAHHKARSRGRGTESERKALDVLKRAA